MHNLKIINLCSIAIIGGVLQIALLQLSASEHD